MRYLGYCYQKGIGCKRDLKTSIENYKKGMKYKDA